MSADLPYRTPSPRPDFPQIERDILARWDQAGTFAQSIRQRQDDTEFVFYDGPPFANGLPHYGHLLTGYVKDVVPRYQTMRGHKVDRRFGWDCHGLPAEMTTEKEIGVSGRVDITQYGIGKFNDACRTSVLRFTKEWERYVTRQARWVDFDNDYKTLDASYMESVMWAFKQLWEKGLLYEAYRVMPYSWGAQTPLSNFEIRLDDATRPRQDPALTVAFAVSEAHASGVDEIWAWTTTPWTLPSNLALAVGPEVEYLVVHSPERNRNICLGANALERYAKQLGEDAHVIARLRGNELAGLRYRPLFDFFADQPNAFRVLVDDYVTDTDGTGVVHMAPGFGEDDQRVCEANGIDLVVPVDEAGAFTSEVSTWEGINVFDANPLVAEACKAQGSLIRHDTYDHNYPHCWRTDTPIIYRAVSSWYVRVTDLTDDLLRHNESINWIPDHVRDGQFGKWLEGSRDWSISRNRFWGAPIPVWRSDNPDYPRVDVYGSIRELEADFGVTITDLHRPFVDDLVRPNPDDPTGQSMMRRVPEVLDCWFESGSMPFAQVHYPFESKAWFDSHSPADFIVEYIAQTRGWFYTMHVLSVALFDRPAFKNVMCHGVVLDAHGKKLSKKLRNYPDPEEVMQTIGADPLRWYLMASPILRGGDLRIAADAHAIAEVVRHVINPLWNAVSFFTRYANVDGYRATYRTDANGLLDRYILAKTSALVASTTAAMDSYDIAGACHLIRDFIDALNNWYIRRSRDRFWAPGSVEAGTFTEDKRDAYDTLYTVLDTVLRVCAPVLPLLSEEMYGIINSGASVHLADWPALSERHDDLVESMDTARAACSAVLRLREDAALRTRLPLNHLVIAGPNAHHLDELTQLIADEVNVRDLELRTDAAGLGEQVLRPNAKVLGPILGKKVQAVLAAAKNHQWELDGDDVVIEGERLTPGQFEISIVPSPGTATQTVKLIDPEGNTVDLGLVVSLDVTVTPELRAEGIARDAIRVIQNLRKEHDLHLTDRIRLRFSADQDLSAAINTHRALIQSATLAVDMEQVEDLGHSIHRFQLEDGELAIELQPA